MLSASERTAKQNELHQLLQALVYRISVNEGYRMIELMHIISEDTDARLTYLESQLGGA